MIKFTPLIVLLAACAPEPEPFPTKTVNATYTPPEASGLIALGAYPRPYDVCQRIGENELTNPYLDHTTFLVGCPDHEQGAVDDRLAEGGRIEARIGAWVLISIPSDGLS